MRIVFLGTGDIGVPSLRALAAEPAHEVVGVHTQPDRPAGRDLKLRASPVKEAARDLGIPVFQPVRIRAADSVEELRSLQPDVLVVVAYGQILPREILDLPRFGCINVHASLLPRHRGASPVHAALLAGDSVSGVTIMQMDEGLDTGPVLSKVETPIGARETAGSLHARLAQLAPDALLRTLDLLGRHQISPEKQDDALATYAPKLARGDGEVAWTQSALAIDQRIRALSPWPGAFTYLPQAKPVLLKIHRASAAGGAAGHPGEVLAAGPDGIVIGAGEGAIVLEEVQMAGGRRLSAGDFLRGRAVPVGTRLG